MKTKIIGIILMLVVAPTLVSATNQTNKQIMNPQLKSVDVPTWEKGDSWTYDLTLYIASSPNVTDDMVVEAYGELTYEVLDDSGDIYTIQGKMRPIKGKIILPGTVDLKATRFTSYESTMEIQKTDLAIKKHDYTMKGIVLIMIGSITLPIPIQMQGTRQTEFTPALATMPFPLNDGDNGTMASIELHESTETTMFWGLITIEKEDDLNWHTAEMDYTCNLETITVPAGEYDVYNVTARFTWGLYGEDLFTSCYCEEVGNVAHSITSIDFGETEETYYRMELNLKSTTYSP